VRYFINCRALLAGGVSALALLVAAPALAQAPGASGPAVDEDRVIIVGQTIEETLPQELEKYGNQLEVVDSVEIRNQVYVDAQQALQMKVPGLFVGARGGPFSYMDISLQGSRTQDMLLLVDGVRINNRLYSTTMSDTLPASMIERIEVLKGGQGLFYGTQSAAGVINIVTRGYTDEFNGLLTVGGDTNDSVHLDGYVRGQAGPGNYVLFASQDKSNGFETFDAWAPSATDRDRSIDVLNYGGKYRFELGERVAVDARYQHTDARVDNPNPRLVAFSKNERDEDIASVGVDINAADWAQILVKGYWHDWDSTYTTIRNRLTNAGAGPGVASQLILDLNTGWWFEDQGINALAKLTPGGPFEYLVGYDFQQYSGRDDVLLIAQQEEEVHAFFGQLRSTDDFIENLSFAIGARHNNAGGTKATVWNASARYDFSDYLYAQGNVGTSFLLPTAEELYAIESFEIGNPNLEAEESENLNLGVGGQFGGGGPTFSWQATYFARNIDNLIGFEACDGANPATNCSVLFPNFADPDPSTPVNEFYIDNGFFQNVEGTVEVRGFELLGTADFNNGFSAIASYTDAETTRDDGTQLARIPRRYAKAGGSYDAGQWGADLNVLWTGEVESTSLPVVGVIPYGDYVVVDLAAHVFLDADQKHKLTARLENALDEEYRTSVGQSSPSAGNDTTAAFVFGNRGVPQTFHLSYSYAF
jgi:outer membrane cobalamin receptor